MDQDSQYEQAAQEFGPALERLARAYEFNPDARRDLLQEIHLQIWISFARFDARCSVRTWVYRIAHNIATRHVIRQRRNRERLVSIEDLAGMADSCDSSQTEALASIYALIERLRPIDRQIIVSYLEGLDGASIGEITGLSAANVAMKIHRIKNLLRRLAGEGAVHGE